MREESRGILGSFESPCRPLSVNETSFPVFFFFFFFRHGDCQRILPRTYGFRSISGMERCARTFNCKCIWTNDRWLFEIRSTLLISMTLISNFKFSNVHNLLLSLKYRYFLFSIYSQFKLIRSQWKVKN